MDNKLLSALQYLNVADLDRADWISVGMALKEEGYSCSVWDEWSRNDERYHPGECERLWNGFHGSSKPVKAGTIVQMAQDRGWTYYENNGVMGWNDVIEYDGDDQYTEPSDEWHPAEDLIIYLRTLFEPDEIVAYVTNDAWQTDDGKWVPSKGSYHHTASDLITSLQKHPDDIGYTFGDWKPEAGAWIRFNPVDGKGVKNENVTRFTYALVESDTLPVAEQETLYRKLELPIAAMVNSGGKSLHAIVHVDAENIDEYRKRVEYLYKYLEAHGLPVDRQNSNPSRLSRMPGVTRNGKRQYLVGVNIGRKSWNDWFEYAEGDADDLPEIECLADFIENPPEQAPELIEGLLRQGHKGLIAGPAKAGKSFALMELCVAIAEGQKWLGFQCRKGRVMYINLEIDPASMKNRFRDIYDAWGIPWNNGKDIFVWNLRGHAMRLDDLVPKILRKIQRTGVCAVILDPIYKVITGDENNASEMGAFCNQFDRICAAAGVSMIYCHHHSKGAQGGKKAQDRASGSGVFARDPDMLIDISPLEMTDDIINNVQDHKGATAWRVEFVLREFASPSPLNVWFDWPLHYLDKSGELQSLAPAGSPVGNLAKTGNFSTPQHRKRELEKAFDLCSFDEGPKSIRDLAKYLGKSEQTIKNWVDEFSDEFQRNYGMVSKVKK